MKSVVLAFSLVLSFSAIAQPTDSLTADQILDKSIAFCGGDSKIAALETVNATYLVTEPDQSTAIVNDRIYCGKKYSQSALSRKYSSQSTFFDGKRLSKVDGDSVRHYDNTAAFEEMRLKTYSNIQFGYKSEKYALKRLADKKFKNFDYYVVSATGKNGYTTLNFFDKTNFRLNMIVFPSGNKSLLIDYTFKDGILFNSRIVNTKPGSDKHQTLQLQVIELNQPLGELWFTCPYQKQVVIPPFIKIGRFISVDGPQTTFSRTENLQEYTNEQGKVIKKRYLKWGNSDTIGMIDEEALRNNDRSPETEILVRIVSWNANGYVCQWIAGKYTDTQEYKLVK